MLSVFGSSIIIAILTVVATWAVARWYYGKTHRSLSKIEERTAKEIERLSKTQEEVKSLLDDAYKEGDKRKLRNALLMSTISKIRSKVPGEKFTGLMEARQLEKEIFVDYIFDITIDELEVTQEKEIKWLIKSLLRYYLRR